MSKVSAPVPSNLISLFTIGCNDFTRSSVILVALWIQIIGQIWMQQPLRFGPIITKLCCNTNMKQPMQKTILNWTRVCSHRPNLLHRALGMHEHLHWAMQWLKLYDHPLGGLDVAGRVRCGIDLSLLGLEALILTIIVVLST